MTGAERADVMLRMTFGPNNGVAFSPDGALLAVCSAHHAEVVDARGGRVLRLIRGHGGLVADAAFAPSGAVIVTGSFDGTARTWDTATGRPLVTFAGHGGAVFAVAFSPDGRRVATASEDETARVWDAATGKHLLTLAGHDYTVRSVAFSPDGALLATASGDATARVWDAATGACLATLVPLPSGGYLTLLPDGRYKLRGDPGDRLWWASGLRRLGADAAERRFPEVRRLPDTAVVVPAAAG